MKFIKICPLLLSLLLIAIAGFSQTMETELFLLKVIKKDTGLIIYPRGPMSTDLVVAAVVDKRSHVLYFISRYSDLIDSVHLADEDYELLQRNEVTPIEYYNELCDKAIEMVHTAREQLRKNGKLNAQWQFASRVEELLPVVKTSQNTLQKIISLEKVSEHFMLLKWLVNTEDPKFFTEDTATLYSHYDTSMAGKMVAQKDTFFYYNKNKLARACKAVLVNKKYKLLFCDRNDNLLDSLPLNPKMVAAIVKKKTDVFLLYRGWLEMQKRTNEERLLFLDSINKSNPGSLVFFTGDKGYKTVQVIVAVKKSLVKLLNNIDYTAVPEPKSIATVFHQAYKDQEFYPGLVASLGVAYKTTGTRGQKFYELTDHRGNVMAVVSDKRIGHTTNGATIDYYNADVVSVSDYAPFGAQLAGRTFNSPAYRYGFNGKENDNEVKGQGNQQDYGMRIYDPRLGKFLSVDPITKNYPMLTPYQFASNRPIDGIDLDGLEYARYRMTVDYITGNILSSEVIWHNSKQHNDYGNKGQGVLYEISVWDSWFKEYRSANVQTMVKRNATAALGAISTEYGNYMGATGLKIVGSNGSFTDDDDYSLNPVDAVDNLAYFHDKGYDNLKAKGANSLFNDWGTTPVDEAALNGWNDFRANYNAGDADPYNGQKVTAAERKAAWRGATLFNSVVGNKKVAISNFIRQNYLDKAYKNSSRMGRAEYVKSVEYNYQQFLKIYMEKDDKGNWQRKGDMWAKDDKGNWTPNKPKK